MIPGSSLSTAFPKPINSALREDFCDSALPSLQEVPMIQGSAIDKSDHVSLLWESSVSPKPAHNQVNSPSEGFPSVGEHG